MGKGLTFVPTPGAGGSDRWDLVRDVHLYNRRLKLLDHFQYNQNVRTIPFVGPSSWEPLTEYLHPDIQTLLKHNRELVNKHSHRRYIQRDNLTAEHRMAIDSLKNNKDIIIKPADKGSAIVILDKQQYMQEAYRQLHNTQHYVQLPHSLQTQTRVQVQFILQDLYTLHYITFKQKNFLLGPPTPRPRLFYMLPKIHKDPSTWTVPHEIPMGRPIVSDCESETYNIATYIDHYLNPISHTHPSYIQDTYDFITKLQGIPIPEQAFIFTVDINSLYTNIDTERGLKAVHNAFIQHPDDSRPDKQILQLLKISLTRNDFEFDNKVFLQIQGTAMGKKFAPSYADIYMAEWERTLFLKCTHTPLIYHRYLDDIFGVWQHTTDTFTDFIQLMNTHHPHITCKHITNDTTVDFLDTTVFLTDPIKGVRHFKTKVFFKPTDTHTLLHKHSFHPKHTFRGLIKSQLIRFHRICTDHKDFKDATAILFSALRSRGYARRFLRKIKSDTLHQLQHNITTVLPNSKQVIPLITTFSNSSVQLNNKIKQQFQTMASKHSPLQHYRVISSYRKNPNLRDILVRSKFHSGPPIAPSPLAKYYRQHRFIENGEGGWVIHQQLTLQTDNIIYRITCTRCKLTYIGETKNTLHARLQQHIYNITSNNKTTHLVQHFQEHGLTHFKISGLESSPTWNTKMRRRREQHFIALFNTRHPAGLNGTLL